MCNGSGGGSVAVLVCGGDDTVVLAAIGEGGEAEGVVGVMASFDWVGGVGGSGCLGVRGEGGALQQELHRAARGVEMCGEGAQG